MGKAYRGNITTIDIANKTVNVKIPYLDAVGDYGPLNAYFDVTGAVSGDGVWVISADENSTEDFVALALEGGIAGSGGGVPTTRQIVAGTGLTGGGDLSADRTLAVTYGTTGTTAAAGNDSRITGALQSSVATTKGDLLVATAPATINRFAVGANGSVLVADSTQTAGVKWAALTGGGDVLAANNLSEYTATAATARDNIGAIGAVYIEAVNIPQTSGTTAATNYVLYSTSGITFKAGRVYRADMVGAKFKMGSNVEEQPTVRLVEGSAGTGTVLQDVGQVFLNPNAVVATDEYKGTISFVFGNTTGADITTPLSVVALLRVGGAGHAITLDGSAGSETWYFIVTDIGPASMVIGSVSPNVTLGATFANGSYPTEQASLNATNMYTRIYSAGDPTGWGTVYVTSAQAAMAPGGILHFSFKNVPTTTNVNPLLDGIPAGTTIWLTYHHEDEQGTGGDIPLAQYQSDWATLRSICDAHAKRSQVVLMGVLTEYRCTFGGENWQDWWTGHEDKMAIDCYNLTPTGDAYRAATDIWNIATEMAATTGFPVAIPEYAVVRLATDTDGSGLAACINAQIAYLHANPGIVDAVSWWSESTYLLSSDTVAQDTWRTLCNTPPAANGTLNSLT